MRACVVCVYVCVCVCVCVVVVVVVVVIVAVVVASCLPLFDHVPLLSVLQWKRSSQRNRLQDGVMIMIMMMGW